MVAQRLSTGHCVRVDAGSVPGPIQWVQDPELPKAAE